MRPLLLLAGAAVAAAAAATAGVLASATDLEERAPAAAAAATGLEHDDECEAGTSEADGSCTVSLRQLRASGANMRAAEAEVGGATRETDSARAEDDVSADEAADDGVLDDPLQANKTQDDDDDDNSVGVPGGWGEAAVFGDELQKNLTLHGDSGWGYYNGYYDRRRRRYHDRRRRAAHARNIYTLYHQTSPWAANLIVKSGFRPGTQGWCGGGIYFAKSPAATETKAIGPDSHKGAILQAGVDVGRVRYMSKTCDRSLNRWKVAQSGYDSVSFNPGDGAEFIVYDKAKVVWVKRIK